MTGRPAGPASTVEYVYIEGYVDGWRAARGLLGALPGAGPADVDPLAWPEDTYAPLPDTWEHHPGQGVPADRLPPDLTAASRSTVPRGRVCGDSWRGWTCTRLVGHTGRHACGGGGTVVAVWRTAFDTDVERAS